MKLYGAIATRAQRCLWALEEAGASYAFHPIDFRAGEHLEPWYLKLNPNGRVPTLTDGELVLFESSAICTWVGVRHPESELVPTEPMARALYEQWVTWVMAELEQPLWTMAKHRFALPREHRIPEMKGTAMFEWHRPSEVLARHLENRRFMVGETFTCADIMVAWTLHWARGVNVPLGFDRLEAYCDDMIARPAFEASRVPGTDRS